MGVVRQRRGGERRVGEAGGDRLLHLPEQSRPGLLPRGAPLLWTIAALLGSHALPAELAVRAGELLGLDDETVAALQVQPYRTRGDELRADPTIYRFYELLGVYGPALKEAIHEEFGDGIMSAINCNIEIDRRSDPDGDRVRIVIDGKFLKYQW
ncbi:cyanase [Microbacterium enclense]|uniref:cyanase n=1 Tax=Microbacterium enclense TaxID=993073 RepID=UPI0036D88110